MVPKGNKQLLDTMWLHGVLGSIGEQFDDGEEICGIVVNVRPKQDRISVWTKTAANEALQVGDPRQKLSRAWVAVVLIRRRAVVLGRHVCLGCKLSLCAGVLPHLADKRWPPAQGDAADT
jgi:hypothetical protein